MNALILAGSRPGAPDPLAAYAGVAHKALILLAGETLLARVAAAVRASGATRIAVSANDAAVCAEAARLGLEVIAPAAGPSGSVAAGLAVLGAPLLVTTADHALLTPEWVQRFVADTPADADVAVLLARSDVVEAAATGTKRTYLRFADGAWSGCNLFLLRTPRAADAIGLWARVEADRKRPWRIVRRLGPGLLARYLLGRLRLADAVAHLGRRAGIEAAAVASPFGLAAVDVDKPADLDLVRAITGFPTGPS
ncbi:nucleotidyltransferase family protein [Sphingomonas rubra]|uniref:MobA-like NTP transferase domain-containing protein n=1 Tax=Sphingomonas rubra TaxID=634430 RepID=A0A1I5S9R4_9SPHN|nr:NTP transferase domain-containing protein [Sphingomonas rubra]SFP67297.1 MobA-like NTP transferase domain-containing protein [Sphingomonas rubra]